MKLILSLFFVLALVACKREGTETGNPEHMPVSGAENTATYRIAKMACAKVTTCQALDELEVCMAGQIFSTSYGEPLGLTVENQSLPLWQIMQSELELQITPDASSAILCLNQIDDLDCSENSVVQAYDPLLEEPYQNVSGVLPPACQSVFNP